MWRVDRKGVLEIQVIITSDDDDNDKRRRGLLILLTNVADNHQVNVILLLSHFIIS